MSRSRVERFSLVETPESVELTSLATEVERGLSAKPKKLPCRFFYDEAGSEIFEEICDLPEYYVTRTEAEILENHADDIASAYDQRVTLAELGSGSSTKTRLLIDAMLRRHGGLRYVPVDISRNMLEASALDLLDRYEALEIRAIASEYEVGLRHLRGESDAPKLIAWLGSTIGNLTRDEGAAFLGTVRAAMSPGDRLLVGIDLRKDRAVLEAAYDDSAGVTARFNLNLLERINRELGGHFDLANFAHRAVYDEVSGRVEMHLVSTREQRVSIEELGFEVEFGAQETIHTENSHKYDQAEIDALAASAGLRRDSEWLDARGYFSLNLFAAPDWSAPA
jgi:dimethylhistidine N-methyltransferase